MESTLADASVVTLILHGVGDHSEWNILNKVRDGWRATTEVKTETQEVEIPVAYHKAAPFCDEESANETSPIKTPALIVSSGRSKHVVVPIDWGHLHTRVAWQKFGSSRNPTQLLAFAFISIAHLSVNLFRCIPKARGAWKLLVLLLALSVPAAAFLIYLSVLYLSALLFPYRLSGYKVVLSGLIVISLAIFLKWVVLPAFDLVGDVAYYLGSISRRAKIEMTMGKLIAWAAKSAPGAHILVVGHSLGSVLVTQSIVPVSEGKAYNGRLLILTLGSPLRFLSRVFPEHVQLPAVLANTYFKAASVSFWGNLWRDRDIVGKDLGIVNQPQFAEKSLGDGRHSNYWRDERLWESVISIIQAAETGALASLSAIWRPLPLTDEERKELEATLFYTGGAYARQLGTTLLGLAIAWPIIYGRISYKFPADALRLGLSAGWKVNLTYIVPLLLWMLNGIRFRSTEREQLVRVRNKHRTHLAVLAFWRAWFRGFMIATFVMLARELYRW